MRELYLKEVIDPIADQDSSSDEEFFIPTPPIDPLQRFANPKFKLLSEWVPLVVAPLSEYHKHSIPKQLNE